MYADDTNLTFASEELFSPLTKDLGNLKQWLDSNHLSLNVLRKKCLFTARGRKSFSSLVNHKYTLTGIQLKQSIVTNTLAFRLMKHSRGRIVSLKLSVKLLKYLLSWGGLDRFVPRVPLSQKSLILPHFDYCSAVWGCIGNGLSQKLEKLQNRAARIITGSSWDARSAPILHALKWNSLAYRRPNNWNL